MIAAPQARYVVVRKVQPPEYDRTQYLLLNLSDGHRRVAFPEQITERLGRIDDLPNLSALFTAWHSLRNRSGG